MTYKRWSDEDIILLYKLIDEKLSFRQIGEKLLRTQSSIMHKCKELNIHSKKFLKYHIPIGYRNPGSFLQIVEILPESKVRCVCLHCNKEWVGDIDKVVSSKRIKISCGCLETKKICPVCKHINSNGFVKICINCGYKFDKNCKSLAEEYIDISKDWDYTNNIMFPTYVSSRYSKKINWICHKCGYTWSASPHHRTSKDTTGCPKCASSKGEEKICDILDKYNISYIREYKFKDCIYKRELPFDFYISLLNTCIEYQGAWHEIPHWSSNGEENLKSTKKRDNIKRKFCKKEKIKLLEIHYSDFDKIEEILVRELNLNKEINKEINEETHETL
jgi:hypothetical protein